MDLTPFFEKYGILTPIEKEVNDYGKKKFVITKKQIEETKKEIASEIIKSKYTFLVYFRLYSPFLQKSTTCIYRYSNMQRQYIYYV